MQVRTTNELGLRVRKARRSRSWTQQELARAAGVGRQWIVALEAGKPRVELDKVLQTLAALDMSLSVRDARGSGPSDAGIGIAVPDTDAIVDAHRDPPP
ncbi:helix-turn-helix transcriptional regulator [Candidatus Palauibacter sp.]|uniref:helix-turn-helix transcriptional regulator n=1 Tax=Candidatus Palauibacter sp. TaxID=3101350 RepID=UPI003C6F4D72